MTIFTAYTAATSDDGSGTEDMNFDNTSTTMALGYDSTAIEKYQIWGRFPNVTVPQGSTVLGADFRVEVNADPGLDGFSVTVKGIDADNASAPTDETELVGGSSEPTLTSASDTAVLSNGETDAIELSDLNIGCTTVIQEILNRPGWSSGNAIVIFATYSGDEAEDEIVNFRTYDYTGTTYTPILRINYTAPAGADAVPMALNTYQQMRNM